MSDQNRKWTDEELKELDNIHTELQELVRRSELLTHRVPEAEMELTYDIESCVRRATFESSLLRKRLFHKQRHHA